MPAASWQSMTLSDPTTLKQLLKEKGKKKKKYIGKLN